MKKENFLLKEWTKYFYHEIRTHGILYIAYVQLNFIIIYRVLPINTPSFSISPTSVN